MHWFFKMMVEINPFVDLPTAEQESQVAGPGHVSHDYNGPGPTDRLK